MTYFGVLLTFIVPPLLALLVIVPRDLWGRWLGKPVKVDWKSYWVILGHVLLALVYTTPWDNYLVATNVWWYDARLVTGITLGWVPIEEYTFFVLQTLLSGFWTLGLLRFVSRESGQISPKNRLRWWSSLAVMSLWLVSTFLLLSGWKSGTYLTLILSWALIPVLVQFWFGADILLSRWRLLLPAIAVPTLYLWLVDASALTDGTWVIDPAQTTGLKIGVLPVEEMLFFLMTNVIIAFGVTLMLSPASSARAREWWWRYRRTIKALSHRAGGILARIEARVTPHMGATLEPHPGVVMQVRER